MFWDLDDIQNENCKRIGFNNQKCIVHHCQKDLKEV